MHFNCRILDVFFRLRRIFGRRSRLLRSWSHVVRLHIPWSSHLLRKLVWLGASEPVVQFRLQYPSYRSANGNSTGAASYRTSLRLILRFHPSDGFVSQATLDLGQLEIEIKESPVATLG